jgi:hypothetical protein
MSLVLFGLKNSEPDNEEWSLGMPAVKGSVDTDQENAFQHAFAAAVFMMKTWNMTFHFAVSAGLG